MRADNLPESAETARLALGAARAAGAREAEADAAAGRRRPGKRSPVPSAWGIEQRINKIRENRVAILHRATITPTKLELAADWLDRQGLGRAEDVALAGSYRFDDPAGEVGIEGLLVRRAGEVFHLPLTYRGAPLDGAGAYLVATMEHSVLGHRWVYDAAGDPVALACYAAALEGRQEQASLELWDGGAMVGRRPHTVRLTAEGDGPVGEVRICRVPGDPADRPAAGRCLVAAWDGGAGAIAMAG